MKPKANLVLSLSLVACVLSARGQGANNPPVPSVPRADGSGPSVPSMSSAIGDIPSPPPSAPKTSSPSNPAVPTPAELDAAARAAEKPAVGATTQGTPSNSKAAPASPPNKAWGVEGSPTVSVTGPASPVSEVLDTTTLVQQIRELSLANRAEFLTALETRIDGNDRDLNEMRQTSRQLKGDARTAYLAADNDVRARHKALKRSLKEAHNATPDAWPKARTALAADYEAFSVALVRVEASSAVGR